MPSHCDAKNDIYSTYIIIEDSRDLKKMQGYDHQTRHFSHLPPRCVEMGPSVCVMRHTELESHGQKRTISARQHAPRTGEGHCGSKAGRQAWADRPWKRPRRQWRFASARTSLSRVTSGAALSTQGEQSPSVVLCDQVGSHSAHRSAPAATRHQLVNPENPGGRCQKSNKGLKEHLCHLAEAERLVLQASGAPAMIDKRKRHATQHS